MIIHLSGADTYRSAQRLQELRQAFVAKHDPQGLNTVTLDGDTATSAELRTALTSTGIFTTKRFVALDRYSGQSPITADQLVEVASKVGTGTDTIFVLRDVLSGSSIPKKRPTKSKKAPGKSNVNKDVQLPQAKQELFPALTDAQLLSWIGKRVTGAGATILPAAAQRLVAICNRDTWRIASEVDKLAAYAGGGTIAVSDVEALVRSEYSSDIFAVTDALGLRQHARALQLIHQELASGTNMFSLIATLAGHVRTLYMIAQAQQRGLTSAMMVSELGVHPFVVQKSIVQTKLFSVDELRDLHHRLVAVDQDLKTSPLDAETLMDVIVVRR